MNHKYLLLFSNVSNILARLHCCSATTSSFKLFLLLFKIQIFSISSSNMRWRSIQTFSRKKKKSERISININQSGSEFRIIQTRNNWRGRLTVKNRVFYQLVRYNKRQRVFINQDLAEKINSTQLKVDRKFLISFYSHQENWVASPENLNKFKTQSWNYLEY